MNLESTIFISNLPSIDLHGYDSASAELAINDFILENLKLRNRDFVIIHGIGSGILKKTTHNTLKKSKYVLDYKVCYNNVGSTIVRIKI